MKSNLLRILSIATFAAFAGSASAAFDPVNDDTDIFLQNPAFVLKLGLLALAGLNAAAFHLGPYQRVKEWEVGRTLPSSARLHAALSLGLWLGVIGCGRMIAYV